MQRIPTKIPGGVLQKFTINLKFTWKMQGAQNRSRNLGTEEQSWRDGEPGRALWLV